MVTNESLSSENENGNRVAFYIGGIAMETFCYSETCVAAGEAPDGTILLGDSKNPLADPLSFDRDEVMAFAQRVVTGGFSWAARELK